MARPLHCKHYLIVSINSVKQGCKEQLCNDGSSLVIGVCCLVWIDSEKSVNDRDFRNASRFYQ